jgi:hypothetical protein
MIFPDSNNISLQTSIPRYIPGLCFNPELASFELYPCGEDGRNSPPKNCTMARLAPRDVPDFAKHLLPGTFIKLTCDRFSIASISLPGPGSPAFPSPGPGFPEEQDLVNGAEGSECGTKCFSSYKAANDFKVFTEINQAVAKSNFVCTIVYLRDRWIVVFGKESWVRAQSGAY